MQQTWKLCHRLSLPTETEARKQCPKDNLSRLVIYLANLSAAPSKKTFDTTFTKSPLEKLFPRMIFILLRMRDPLFLRHQGTHSTWAYLAIDVRWLSLCTIDRKQSLNGNIE